MEKETRTISGACKFCGQSQMVIADSEEAANEIAETSCSCKEGQPARRIKVAGEKVAEKFGDFSGETMDLINKCVAAVNYGIVKSASLTLSGRTKVSIALAGGEKISVTRTDTDVDKEEIS